jgi:UDP-2,3-diacylglucosamine hydrolase
MMSTVCFFISDAHLGAESRFSSKMRMDSLISFLSYITEKNGRLFILGDLFDFWFEYKYVIPREFFPLLTAFEKFRKTGQIDYIVGNHDFWAGRFFTDELDIPVHANEFEAEINGSRLYMHHGDGIAAKDKGYRILKRVLRHPLNIELYRILHPDFGFSMAHYFSGLSRKNSPPEDHDKDYAVFALEKLKQGFDAVIMGHTHCPELIQHDNGVYLNTGEWISRFSYGLWENGRFSINYWQQT